MRGLCCTTEGFVHVSCLTEQAKILFVEAEENNLGLKARNARWDRWHKCSLCEQSTTASWPARSGGRAGRRTWTAGTTASEIGDELAWLGLFSANHAQALSCKWFCQDARRWRLESNVLAAQSNLGASSLWTERVRPCA